LTRALKADTILVDVSHHGRHDDATDDDHRLDRVVIARVALRPAMR